MLSITPLRVYEWHHILAFIREQVPLCLQEWRDSDTFTENDDQLERQIRTISRGLVEVASTTNVPQVDSDDAMSHRAGAGSFLEEGGGTRVVQFIHESAREFFRERAGFSILRSPGSDRRSVGDGHLSIMQTCFDYVQIRELDALVEAREEIRTGICYRKPRPWKENQPSKLHFGFKRRPGCQCEEKSGRGFAYRKTPALGRRSSLASFSSASSHVESDGPLTYDVETRRTRRGRGRQGRRPKRPKRPKRPQRPSRSRRPTLRT